MNCDVVQNRLLSCDRPDLPPVDLKGHLVACPVCRAWHRRLVRLQQQLPKLPVPPSETKQAFLQRLVAEPARTEQVTPVVPQLVRYNPRVPSRKERGLQKMALAFAMAAAMLLFAVGWWALHRPAPVRAGSSEEARALADDLNNRLAYRMLRSGTPRQGVENMAELADELHRKAVELSRPEDAEQLAVLARYYGKVVRDHLLTFARYLPPNGRPDLLEAVTDRLARTESELEGLAAAANEGSAESLRAIAATARDAVRDLQALKVESTPRLTTSPLV
jgi:hypothetical protein